MNPKLSPAGAEAGEARANHAVDLSIEGMPCASCVARVEKALLRVPGVATAAVNLATERAHVELAPSLDAGELVRAVERAGYQARPVVPNTAPSHTAAHV